MVKYVCDNCGAEFPHKTTYDIHLTRKTDCSNDIYIRKITVNKCGFCKKKFSRKDNLMRHLKKCPVKNNEDIADKIKVAGIQGDVYIIHNNNTEGNSPPKRTVTESVKKTIAARQGFECANKPGSNIKGLEGYDCPLWQKKKNPGRFDEALYHIDHKKEFCMTYDDSEGNLQALCRMCHDVKTKRFNQINKKKKKDTSNEDDEDESANPRQKPKKKIILSDDDGDEDRSVSSKRQKPKKKNILSDEEDESTTPRRRQKPKTKKQIIFTDDDTDDDTDDEAEIPSKARKKNLKDSFSDDDKQAVECTQNMTKMKEIVDNYKKVMTDLVLQVQELKNEVEYLKKGSKKK